VHIDAIEVTLAATAQGSVITFETTLVGAA